LTADPGQEYIFLETGFLIFIFLHAHAIKVIRGLSERVEGWAGWRITA
jgi:hypothetical protein